jgi:hypothetical protein
MNINGCVLIQLYPPIRGIYPTLLNPRTTTQNRLQRGTGLLEITESFFRTIHQTSGGQELTPKHHSISSSPKFMGRNSHQFQNFNLQTSTEMMKNGKKITIRDDTLLSTSRALCPDPSQPPTPP